MNNKSSKTEHATGEIQRDPAKEAYLNELLERLADEGILDRQGWKYGDDGSRKRVYRVTEYGRALANWHHVTEKDRPSIDGTVQSVDC